MTSLQQNNTDDGLLHSTTQQITNLTLMDNRETLDESTREGLYPGANSSIHQLNEDQWNLLKLCSRPTLIGTFDWTTATTSPLAEITLPIQATNISSYWHQLFKTFSFAKFDMNVRIQINSTKFHSGRLAVVWNPMSSFEPPTSGIPARIWSATSLPNAILDASMSNSAELVMPFQHYYSYLPLVGEDNVSSTALGTLTIENLTGLQLISPTSPTVVGKIWFWFTNIELFVPITSHTPFGPIESQSGVLEQKLILAEELGTKTAKFIGAGRDVVGTGAKLFGLADSPSDPLPQGKVMMSNGPTAHGRGVSSAIRLALDPVSSITTKPADTGTIVDEMDLKHVISKSALVAVKEITTDFTLNIPVNPMTVLDQDTNIYPTFLAYVARKFAFWRGPLRYRFEFVCSNFHTGRFLVSFIPNQSNYTGSIEGLGSCPTVILDLQEKRSFEFIVPYISQQPYKTISEFTKINSALEFRAATGTLQIRSLNTVTYPGTVSPFCQLWIFVSADEGFELAVPNSYKNMTTQNLIIKDTGIFDNPNSIQVEAQSAFLSTETDRTTAPILGNTKAITLNDPSLYGEKFMHLSNYLARNSCSFRYDLARVNQWVYEIPIGTDLKFLTQTGENVPFRDNITWFSKLYTFWRGSIRTASLNNFGRTVNGTLTALVEPLSLETSNAYGYKLNIDTNPIYDSMSGNAFQFTNTPMSPVIEIETPYYTQFQNMLNRSPIEGKIKFYPDFQEARFAGGLNLIYDIGKEETDYNFRFAGYITRSAGPDFHFSFLGRPPILSN